jgi:predicted dithiol-disulfide oxidoreductase (DUF899 family)
MMLVFKNKTAVTCILSSPIAKIEAVKSRQSFKMRITSNISCDFHRARSICSCRRQAIANAKSGAGMGL